MLLLLLKKVKKKIFSVQNAKNRIGQENLRPELVSFRNLCLCLIPLFLPLILHALTLLQCDKMDRLFAQESVIYSKDDLSNGIKNCKGEIYKGANELKILSNYVETFKISPKQQ